MDRLRALDGLSEELEEHDQLLDRGTIMAEILAETGGQDLSIDELRALASARLHAKMSKPLGAGALAPVPELPTFHSMQG